MIEQVRFELDDETIGEVPETITCLYNGQYGPHSLSEINVAPKQMTQLLNVQKKAYEKYIGKEFGDFVCENIEYDWGKHKQSWAVRCKLCGKLFYKDNGYQWSRGKTGSMSCECRKNRKKEQERLNRQFKENEKLKQEEEIRNEIGKVYGNYRVISCDGLGDNHCIVQCEKCGAIRKRNGILRLRRGEFQTCNCGIMNYSDPDLIGTRNGNCVFVGLEGNRAKIRCDCGRERIVNKTAFFKYHSYKNCGSYECPYASDTEKKSRKNRNDGLSYEIEAEWLLTTNGYTVKRIGRSGDFGVDLIAVRSDGLKIAVQCKCNKSVAVGVGAMQEVYAGGAYYGITHFAVIAFGVVTKAALKMAKKLGIYISDGNTFEYPENIEKYANDLVPTIQIHANTRTKKLYEINGEWKTLNDWAYIYGTSCYNINKGLKRGLTLETAVHFKPKDEKKYTIRGITDSIEGLCRHFGVVSSQTARYRIGRGMSIEEAVLTEKMQLGRPRKNDQLTFY